MCDVSLTVAMTLQWQRDFDAWMADPASDTTAVELLGRAAARIESLLQAITGLAAPAGRYIVGPDGVPYGPFPAVRRG